MARNEELKSLAQTYATKYGLRESDLEKGLEGYAVHLFAQEQGLDAVLGGMPTEDADLSDSILRNKDLGVDGALFDDSAKRIVLIQCTWRSNARGVEEKFNSFVSVLDRIGDPEYVRSGSVIAQELLGSIPQRLRDGYSVELRFVTNLPVGTNERLTLAMNAANRKFEREESPTVQVEIFGSAELERRRFELSAAHAGSAVQDAVFSVQRANMIEWDGAGGDRKTLIGVLKGNELHALYKRYRNELFSANIRLPLITGKVNPEIRQTAQESPENFFYYNNGVSAVCKRFSLHDTKVHATGLQIINGAQTVKALVDSLDDVPQRDLYVLFRLTETSEGYKGAFTESAIRYNNTQNPVKVADFFANDEIQVWLSKNLTALSGKGPLHSFYYVHKSGYAPARTQGLRKLTIDDFARIRHSFIYGPTVSYREPATFFDRNGKYAQAFGVGAPPKVLPTWDRETLSEAAVAIAINEKVQALSKKFKKDPRRKDDPETRYLFRLSRYVLALVAVGLREQRGSAFHDYSSIASSEAAFNAVVNPLVKIALRLVKAEMLSLGQKYVQPEYNFARDDGAWDRMRTLMIGEVLNDDLDYDL